ncbi:MAG TPA: prolyl oligopeptidase family serine peptidase [Gemmatimonadaceae bacterium]|jgi:dipeptidyl aminopeptidase/acylaminoacyl peptidase
MRRLFVLLAVLAAPILGAAQDSTAAKPAAAKPATPQPLSLTDLLTWKSIRSSQVSNDGKWFAYVLAPNEGDGDVVIRATASGAKEMKFPVGEAPAAGGFGGFGGFGGALPLAPVSLSGNGKWAAFVVYPKSADAKRARRTRASLSNRLSVVELATGTKRDFERVRAYRFGGDKSDWIAIHHTAPDAAPAGGAGGGAPAGGGTVLEVVNLAGGTPITIAGVSEFAFDESGRWLAYTLDARDLIGNSLQLREVATGVTRSLDAAKASYRRLAWIDSGDALAILRSTVDTATSDTSFSVLGFKGLNGAAPTSFEVNAKSAGIDGGLVVSGDRSPRWGETQAVLYFGLREPRPPRPREAAGNFTPPSPGGTAPGAGNTGQVAAAPQTDEDMPSLILWHWKDPRLQAQQQVQEAQDKTFSYLAAYHVGTAKVVRLADAKVRDVQTASRDRWAVGTDITPYERQASVDGKAFRDVYAIDITTGARKPLATKLRGGGGFGGGVTFSPDGERAAFYDDGDYKVYDFATATTRTLTTGVDAKFWDDEDDHNTIKPQAAPPLGWSKDGSALLVRDNWDVWKLPLKGAAQNLTANGRKDRIRYQARVGAPYRERGIDVAKPLLFETYGEWTKKEGLSRVDAIKGGATVITWEENKVDYRKARDADTWFFTRQTVVKYPDVYAADAGLVNERRLTDANPQQKDVLWSSGARLVNYVCDHGDTLQGALFLPANYENGKKYPTLTYIYEKLSQGYNVYPQPNATRYANPAVYTSRGYAFFQPDITYKLDDPGRSAVACVVPAVKAAIATGIVDPSRVGLQGHSWGGYQTTFITTQTDIFKTAIAGAPLTDMVSMFSSVYWNSGSANQPIFISSQGRFSDSYARNPDPYIRNSPNRFANNLKMPFMILHNDRDGAVDFNQGITYYNTLRELGKDVVLLEYVGENHGLSRPANQKDYAVRMQEWFDTFLRDMPAPDWLKDGVPRLQMEQHLKDRRSLVDPTAKKAEERKATP